MSRQVSSFDVLKLMCERNMKIQLAPLENVTYLRKVKAGTQVTIGVGGDVIGSIYAGKFVGGLILADKEQFREIEKELEAKP
jgi:hypothetical protein